MTEPNQPQPGWGGPQYGAPGTGPGQPQDPGGQAYSGGYDQSGGGYGQQAQYGAPGYGQQPGYGQPVGGQPGYGQQPGYPVPVGGGYPPDQDAPYGRNAYGEPYSDKSKLVAGLLEIFLGSFGVGRFYLGYPGLAIAQIAVTWLTCGIGHIWPLIDGIMILTGKVRDPYGRPLQES
ncbi:TM2 domain-containing protein [Nocardia sp. BMG111209]|uniref:TM2 domain-containing protein n=1 Tax=Nocardia sp. BMG111209 TaxID=1160137 RepID=UPI0003705DAB|nr:TM2 domain-containing protein [Nocardia sp. BMG111209]